MCVHLIYLICFFVQIVGWLCRSNVGLRTLAWCCDCVAGVLRFEKFYKVPVNSLLFHCNVDFQCGFFLRRRVEEVYFPLLFLRDAFLGLVSRVFGCSCLLKIRIGECNYSEKLWLLMQLTRKNMQLGDNIRL